MLLIFLENCVVFCGGVRVAHLFSFLCCVFLMSGSNPAHLFKPTENCFDQQHGSCRKKHLFRKLKSCVFWRGSCRKTSF